jgi:Protein of unknown function (DUF2752)
MRLLTPELKQALRIVWLVVSLLILGALAAPFTLGRERVARLVPICEWKSRYGRECAFCGMTTSFLDISEGRFGEATHANRAGIPLYLLFVSNEAGLLALARKLGAPKKGQPCKP